MLFSSPLIRSTTFSVVIIDDCPIYANGIQTSLQHYFTVGKGVSDLQFNCFPKCSSTHSTVLAKARHIYVRVPDDLLQSTINKQLALLRKTAPEATIILYSYRFNAACVKVLCMKKKIIGYFLLAENPSNLVLFYDRILFSETVSLSAEATKEMVLYEANRIIKQAILGNSAFLPQEAKYIEMLYENKSKSYIMSHLQISFPMYRKVTKSVLRKLDYLTKNN